MQCLRSCLRNNREIPSQHNEHFGRKRFHGDQFSTPLPLPYEGFALAASVPENKAEKKKKNNKEKQGR